MGLRSSSSPAPPTASSVLFGISYTAQIWVYRVLFFVAPAVALLVTKRVCDELVAGERVERSRRAGFAPGAVREPRT